MEQLGKAREIVAGELVSIQNATLNLVGDDQRLSLTDVFIPANIPLRFFLIPYSLV